MEFSASFLLELVGGALTLAGSLFATVRYLMGQIEAVRIEGQFALKEAIRQVDDRTTRLEGGTRAEFNGLAQQIIAEGKEYGRTFATLREVEQMENRIITQMNRVEEKLDRLIEGQSRRGAVP